MSRDGDRIEAPIGLVPDVAEFLEIAADEVYGYEQGMLLGFQQVYNADSLHKPVPCAYPGMDASEVLHRSASYIDTWGYQIPGVSSLTLESLRDAVWMRKRFMDESYRELSHMDGYDDAVRFGSHPWPALRVDTQGSKVRGVFAFGEVNPATLVSPLNMDAFRDCRLGVAVFDNNGRRLTTLCCRRTIGEIAADENPEAYEWSGLDITLPGQTSQKLTFASFLTDEEFSDGDTPQGSVWSANYKEGTGILEVEGVVSMITVELGFRYGKGKLTVRPTVRNYGESKTLRDARLYYMSMDAPDSDDDSYRGLEGEELLESPVTIAADGTYSYEDVTLDISGHDQMFLQFYCDILPQHMADGTIWTNDGTEDAEDEDDAEEEESGAEEG